MCAAVLQTAEWMYDVVDPRTRTRVTVWASDQQIEQAKIPRRHCGHQVPVVGHAVEGPRTAEPPAAVRAAEARVGGAVASALLGSHGNIACQSAVRTIAAVWQRGSRHSAPPHHGIA